MRVSGVESYIIVGLLFDVEYRILLDKLARSTLKVVPKQVGPDVIARPVMFGRIKNDPLHFRENTLLMAACERSFLWRKIISVYPTGMSAIASYLLPNGRSVADPTIFQKHVISDMELCDDVGSRSNCPIFGNFGTDESDN